MFKVVFTDDTPTILVMIPAAEARQPGRPSLSRRTDRVRRPKVDPYAAEPGSTIFELPNKPR